MNHIKSFESFKNEQLNEGAFDFLKKIFNQMFAGLGEIYTQQTQRVFKDIENQTQPKAVYDILKKFLVISKNNFNKDMEGATDITKLRDASYSNMVSLYATFETAAKKLSNNKVSFNNVFGETPPKEIRKIFNQKDTKKREQMMVEFSNALIRNVGGGLKIDDNDLAEMEKTPVGAEPKKKPEEKEKANTKDTKDTQNTTEADKKTKDAKAEQDAKFKSEQQKADIKTGEQSTTPAATTESIQFILEEVSTEQLTNLKDLINQWYASNIYDKIEKNINTISKAAPANDDINKIIDNVKNTNHKDNLKKMLTSIANLDDANKYAEIRDALIKLGYIKKDDIGVF